MSTRSGSGDACGVRRGRALDVSARVGVRPRAAATEKAVAEAAAGGARFAAYVAHELRTPLSTQRALLELALHDPNADVADWRAIGEEVLSACKQQERILAACLVLARSREELSCREPIDLAAIAADALRAGPHGLERAVDLQPAWTRGDPDLLERLVVNLVSNGTRHNVAGGRIEVATRSEPGRAIFSVANTGPLVPAIELERLFRPFQRLDANDSGGVGLGLGLAIVQAIAAAHDARLTVRSRAGGGLEIDAAFRGEPVASAPGSPP